MAIPTTQKECTTRRIAALIIGLWDKIKNAFLLKTSRGAANGVASLDANGKVPTSQLPQGIYSDKLNVDGSNGTENGVSALINKLSTGSSTPGDDDYYVSQFAGGGTTTTSYHRRPVLALWTYIKSKIESVLGLTANNYGGNAATAYWATLAGTSPAKWYSLGTVDATSGPSAGYSFLIYGGQNIGENADNIWHLTVSNRNSSRKIIYTQLAGERATDIQFGCTVGKNNAITVYMKRPAYSSLMRFVLLTSSNATPSITEVSGEPSGYIAGTERHIPLIEHVNSIPVSPTVGTIYAL